MALGEFTDSKSSNIYLKIVDGSLRVRVKEGSEGAVSRTTKEGKVVWEKPYPWVQGVITDVYYQKNEVLNSVQLYIDMSDAGERYQLEIPMSSNFAENFITKLPNIPVGTVLTLRPYSYPDNNKKDKKGNPRVNRGITVKIGDLNGQTIERFYTKENRADMPEYTEAIAKDEDELAAWKLAMAKFYKKVVDKQRERFKVEVPKPVDSNNVNQAEEDDLPF